MPLSAKAASNKDKASGKSATLQHRHFAFIAAVLLDAKPGKNWDPNKMVQWETTVHRFVDAMIRANPRFDRLRFYKAAGMENGPHA